MSGFEFRETMSGSYHRLDTPTEERPMAFTGRMRSASFWRFLRDPVLAMDGTIKAEGLATDRPVQGTLGVYLAQKGKLIYSFGFTGDDGAAYRFEGEKNVTIQTLPESMTVLPGCILRDGGAPVAEALLRFDLRGDLLKFLGTFRLLW